MKNIELERKAKNKKISRDIVKTILDFGVNENQKIDIMYNLALTLENNSAMKEIVNVLNNFKTTINNLEENDYKKNNKILTWGHYERQISRTIWRA